MKFQGKKIAYISGGTSIGEIPKGILIFKALAPGYNNIVIVKDLTRIAIIH